MLAIDISRTSLAYARRKTREAGIANIEYAQADILKLGTLERRFDVIETVGVLHHLAEPTAGLRVADVAAQAGRADAGRALQRIGTAPGCGEPRP